MIKVFEMFSGYGGASFALKKANIPFEVVGFSEIDKFAIQCYEQNHCKDILMDSVRGIKHKYPLNFGDCTKINHKKLPDFDLLTGGFPCQSFSIAGKGLGEQDTRGTLFYDIIRIAEVKKPKFMLLENVKGLLSKKHKNTFEKILSELKRIGYYVKWKLLNSKDYGIPQNRERVFFVCFREKVNFESFKWPEKQELNLFLKDILEESVDDKYYLKHEKTNKLLLDLKPEQKKLLMPKASYCIDNNYHKGTNLKGYLEKRRRQLVMPVITPDRLNKRQNGRRFKNDKEPMFTINTQDRHGILINGNTIRKLTPIECFRLMGFLNDEINLERISDTQRYKLAGNGWDVNLVSKIFEQMFKIDKRNRK